MIDHRVSTFALAMMLSSAASGQVLPPPPAGPDAPSARAAIGVPTSPAPGSTISDAAAKPDATEIIVTAQKRSENLLKVPISITALTGKAINDAGSKNLIELQGIAPGLYVSGNTGYSVTPIAIRGVSGTGNALGDEPVAVYVDGVFQNAQTISTGDFLDLGGLEIVRGPQGTLQGRNSTAGAILIRSHDPENRVGGYVRGSVQSPTEFRGQAAITGPLGPNLSARFAAGYVDEYGWAHNSATGTRAGGQSSTAFRGILMWRPGTSRIRLSGGWNKTSSSVAIARFAKTVVNPTGQAIVLGVNATPKTPLPDALQSSILNDYNTPLNVILKANTKNPYVTLEATFGLGPVDLVSISGFSKLNMRGQSDSDGLGDFDSVGNPLNGRQGYNTNHQTVKTLSQEVRLQSNGGGPLSFILGGYATHIVATQDIRLFNNFLSAPRAQYLHSDAHQVNDAFAPFADATFKPSDKFALTAGIRYTYETKDFRRTSGFYNLVTDALFPFLPNGTYAPPKAKFKNTSYRAKAAYTPSSQALFYISYAKGFKSGGFNALGNDPVFEPETLTSAELGFKLGLLDRHLLLTGSVYSNKYNNLQVTSGVPAGGVRIYNAAKAKIDGGELEAHLRANDLLTIDANVAYTNARYTSFPLAQGKPPVHTQFGQDRRGNTGGRPKGTRNADTVVTKALAVRFGVTQNGKDRTMSKLEAAVTQLVNKAAGGDLKAIALVLRLNREIETRAQPYGETQPLAEADRTVLEQFAAQVRARKEKGDVQG